MVQCVANFFMLGEIYGSKRRKLGLQLPVNDRLEIASQLLDTVTPDDDVLQLSDPSLIEELDRRFRRPRGKAYRGMSCAAKADCTSRSRRRVPGGPPNQNAKNGRSFRRFSSPCCPRVPQHKGLVQGPIPETAAAICPVGRSRDESHFSKPGRVTPPDGRISLCSQSPVSPSCSSSDGLTRICLWYLR